ncbi:hypothetical protein ACFW2Y_17285 [Streptomyces sp. NPDC058877]|uniref:hypothetical protein n=1 Tax=unclassified Streptomyces TaxID=2593676 RepID=UPI0036900D02
MEVRSDADLKTLDRIDIDTRVGLWARLGWGPAGGGRSVTGETVTAHIREETPIEVIRLLMDTTHKEDALVHTDLTTGEVAPDGVLVDALRERHDDDRVRITCEAPGVRGGFENAECSTGELRARCPGKVPTWNSERGS